MGDELKVLARAYADGEITESQLQRLESILQSDAEARQQYLQELNLINALEDLSMTAESQRPDGIRDTHRVGILHRTTVRVAGVAAAVLLILYLTIQNDSPSQSAMAAVQRSFDVAAQPTTRKYLLQIEYRTANGGTRTTEVELYVGGNDRFALRHPSPLPGTNIWLGRDGAESWIVPPIGPVLKGDHTLHRRWAREELDIPDLHVSTLLTQMMSRGYRLETLRDEQIALPDGLAAECQHIRADRKTAGQPDLPQAIELWASRESGMAVRLIVRWALGEAEAGKESVVLSFQGDEPSLSDDWFTAEAHVSNERSQDSPRDDVDR